MNLPRFFFSCDWGTTSFRLRLVSFPDRTIRGEIQLPHGVKSIQAQLPHLASNSPEARAQAFSEFFHAQCVELARGVDLPRPGFPAVISGMASSSVGWREVPYARAPFSLGGKDLAYAHFPGATELVSKIWLLSGIATATDILRGEETEILGLLTFPEFQALARGCVVILPGTHSKHLWIQDGALIDFQTHMTGELFDVLATHSLLKVSVQASAAEAGLPHASFSDTLREHFADGVCLARDRGLGRGLFRVRTRSVLDSFPPEANRSFLSGVLIGAELTDLGAQEIRGSEKAPILLAASDKFTKSYQWALDILGIGDRIVQATPAQISGAPVAAHAQFLERLAAEGRLA